MASNNVARETKAEAAFMFHVYLMRPRIWNTWKHLRARCYFRMRFKDKCMKMSQRYKEWFFTRLVAYVAAHPRRKRSTSTSPSATRE